MKTSIRLGSPCRLSGTPPPASSPAAGLPLALLRPTPSHTHTHTREPELAGPVHWGSTSGYPREWLLWYSCLADLPNKDLLGLLVWNLRTKEGLSKAEKLAVTPPKYRQQHYKGIRYMYMEKKKKKPKTTQVIWRTSNTHVMLLV